tara:strand:- start:960 stop:1064 length:105 start_codon:yes stop_codon:yes gene_type:complete
VLVVMARTLFYFHHASKAAGSASNVVHGTVLEIV